MYQLSVVNNLIMWVYASSLFNKHLQSILRELIVTVIAQLRVLLSL